MTRRQKALGVTEYGYQRGVKEGEFLADMECFLAKMATGVRTKNWTPTPYSPDESPAYFAALYFSNIASFRAFLCFLPNGYTRSFP